MNCYLCGQKHLQVFAKKNGILLHRCADCGLIFYDFHGDYQQFLEKQYHRGYFQGQKDLWAYYDYGGDKDFILRNLKWYLKKILLFKKEGLLLDIGCAYGYFLELAKKHFDVFGIDPSEFAITQARIRFPRKVKKGTLEDTSFTSKFEVVTLFDVFEHLEDPKKDLCLINNLLNNEGLLVISTGDTNSFWAKLAGVSWTFNNPPQHIYYFNQKNIIRILEETGFKILMIDRSGKWLRFHYVFHLASTAGESRLAKLLYPLIKNNFIGKIPLYLKLNDNMVIFAKKIHV